MSKIPGSAQAITLGVHPTARGFGWVAFNGPFNVMRSGAFVATLDKNEKCLQRFRKLLVEFEPESLVIEDFGEEGSDRSKRVRRLCLAMVTLAADRGVELSVFTRDEVAAAFGPAGARTREEIAQAVAQTVPALSYRTPKTRRHGDSEDKRLSVFCAAALVLTHFQNGATALLDDLRNAA